MRIMIAGTANLPALNGQAVFTENLAKGLARQGHDVLMIFPSEKGAGYQTTMDLVSIQAIRSTNLNKIHSGAYFSVFSEKIIHQIMRAFNPEIVHIQDHFPLSRDVVRVARRTGHKLVGTNHFMPENLAPYVPVISKFKPVYNRIMWSWMLEVYNHLDVVTAQSKASAAMLRAQGLRVPVFPVSCGINLDRFTPIRNVDRAATLRRFGLDPARKIFLFVGRVDKEKRLDVLLNAMSQLQRDDIQFVISGHGAAQESLQSLVAELNLGERVRFTGFVAQEDLPVLLNSADIFCMPSEAELLSIATLEAMACARPVLLANAVALPELVTDGLNGYLFRPGDPVDAARTMSMLADHPEKWSAMGRASQEKAHYHGIENTLKQYENIYTTLLASPASAASTVTKNPKGELIGSKQ
jgi:glycosyltransferase involved in cell wall biosynthesis